MSERFFDKFGFQMIQQNQAFMRCPHDVKGVFFDIRIMAGNSEHEDGTIPVGANSRATRDDLINYLTDFDRSKRNYYDKVLKRLVAVGALEFFGKDDKVRIPYYEDEQALGRTVDTNRKRSKANADLLEMVNSAGGKLRSLFKRSNATGLPHETLVDYIRREFSCYRPKAEEILSRMAERGVLYIREDGLSTLASLAPPPESGSAGSGAEFTASRKIPLESDSESESEKEGAYAPSAGSAETRPRGPSEPPGSAASGTGGGGASEASGLVLSPEDAWHVRDPLQAIEVFLSGKNGWSDEAGEAGPPSKFALRAKWRDLRQAVGVKEAERIWRQAIFDIVTDHCDGQSWRSWVAGFLTKLNIARQVSESLREADHV